MAWMLVEAAVALTSGAAAHSLSLIAFGADSVIEMASAAVLLWRLSVELRDGATFSPTVEHRASKIAGALLFGLAGYIVISAAFALRRRSGQDFTLVGLALTLLSIPIMWFLAKQKLLVAAEIGSRALRADAVEAITCGYLSVAVALGLAVQFLRPGWWWIDSVASLMIVWFLIKEGREAWSGDDCCD